MIFIKLNVTRSQTPRAQSRPLATEPCLHGLEHVGLPIHVTVWILPCGFRPELRWPRQTVSVWIHLLPLPVVTVTLPLKFCISVLCGLSGAVSGLEFEHLGTPFRDTDAGSAPRGGWEDTAVHGGTHSHREIQAHGNWLQDVFWVSFLPFTAKWSRWHSTGPAGTLLRSLLLS